MQVGRVAGVHETVNAIHEESGPDHPVGECNSSISTPLFPSVMSLALCRLATSSQALPEAQRSPARAQAQRQETHRSRRAPPSWPRASPGSWVAPFCRQLRPLPHNTVALHAEVSPDSKPLMRRKLTAAKRRGGPRHRRCYPRGHRHSQVRGVDGGASRCSRVVSTWPISSGFSDHMRATVPVTCGTAKEVPSRCSR